MAIIEFIGTIDEDSDLMNCKISDTDNILEKKMNKMEDDITKIDSLQTEIQEDISKMKEGLEKLIKSLSK